MGAITSRPTSLIRAYIVVKTSSNNQRNHV